MTKQRCEAPTLQGKPCSRFVQKGQEKCWHHQGVQCSVCLSCITNQSLSRKLDCGHEFHVKCLDRWKTTCTTPDPTCPMCRVPFDVPNYRCRLIIERVVDSSRTVNDFTTSNVTGIMQGFGLDFRQLIPQTDGRFFTDIHFDIEEGEVLDDILRELGLPLPQSE